MSIPRARSGERRHPVRVEQKSTIQGSMGEVVESWGTFTSLRCRIWPGKGKEAEEARRETGKVTTLFFDRFQPGIHIGMRLVFNSRTFDITNVANIGEMNRDMEITAVETI